MSVHMYVSCPLPMRFFLRQGTGACVPRPRTGACVRRPRVEPLKRGGVPNWTCQPRPTPKLTAIDRF